MAKVKPMTTRQQLDELRESVVAHDRQIERLIRAMQAERQTVSALAATVVAHDNQIEALIRFANRTSQDIRRVDDQIANLTRQWQAYLNRLPPQ
jgi:chromosome segregation ATPase